MTWKIIVDSDCCDFILYWDYTKCNHIDSKTGICCEKHCPTKTLEKLKQKLIDDFDKKRKLWHNDFVLDKLRYLKIIEKRFGGCLKKKEGD